MKTFRLLQITLAILTFVLLSQETMWAVPIAFLFGVVCTHADMRKRRETGE